MVYLRSADSRLFTVRAEKPAPPAAGRATSGAGAEENAWRVVRIIGTPGQGVHRLSFGAGGTLLAAAEPAGVVRVWDTASGAEVAAQAHADMKVNRIAFSPRGDQIVSGWSDGTVRLFDRSAARQPGAPAPAADPERPLTEAETGRLRSEMARIYDTQDRAEACLRSAGYPVDLGPVWQDDAPDFWLNVFFDIESGLIPGPAPFHRILRLALRTAASPALKALARDLAAGRPTTADGERILHQYAGSVRVACSPDGLTIASAGRGGPVLLYRLPNARADSGRHVQPKPRALAFSPDGSLLAVARAAGDVVLLPADQAGHGAAFSQNDAAAADLEFSPGGRLLATVLLDGTVRLREVPGGRILRSCNHGAAGTRGVAFSPGGTLLAVAAGSQVVFLDTQTLLPARRPSVHGAEVSALAFARGSRLLAVACGDGTIELIE